MGAGQPDDGDRRLPRPDRRWIALAVLITVYLGFAVNYARAIPPWQSPDEPAHFNYIAEVAETGRLPVLKMGDYDADYLETLKSRGFPPDLPIDNIRYEGHQPPLYYLGGAVVYRLVSPAPQPRLLMALRIYSIALGVISLGLAFLIGRLILPGWLALGPPLFIAGIPQRLAITGSVNNDALAELLMAALLLALLVPLAVRSPGPVAEPRGVALGGSSDAGAGGTVRPADAGRTRQDRTSSPGRPVDSWAGYPVAVGGLLGLMLLTKTTLYIALPLVPLAYRLANPSLGRCHLIRVLRCSLVSYLVALLVSAPWFIRNALTYGPGDPLAQTAHDRIVTGQPAPVWTAEALTHFVVTLFRSFWGQFGWMGVPMDERTYRLLTIASAILAAGLVIWLWRRQRRGWTRWEARWLILIGAVTGLLLIGVAGYNLKYIQPQGRYLFTALVPFGIAATLGVRGLLTDRWAPYGLIGVALALALLDWWALNHVILGAFGR